MVTIDQAVQAIRNMQEQDNMDDDEMLGILYMMFQDDKLSLNELGAILDKLGYEFTEEFLNMSPEDQKIKGYEFFDE